MIKWRCFIISFGVKKMEKPVQVSVKNIKSSETCILLKLYEKGRLGKFPQAENRLRAGLMFMKDFRFSLFSQKTTRSYDKLFVPGIRGKNDSSDLRCDAADRYLRALKAVGIYGVYALHFLRDEQNVSAFLARYPVLNKGARRTYKMVYLAVNKMLDKLVDFYDAEKR